MQVEGWYTIYWVEDGKEKTLYNNIKADELDEILFDLHMKGEKALVRFLRWNVS